MRGETDQLVTPYPMSSLLPGYLQEDEFTVRLTSALDSVIAPVISVLDCLDAYFDPRTAPPDFLEWLADWVGAPLDDTWPDALKRDAVLRATRLHRGRGTTAGLLELLELVVPGEVELHDSGQVVTSASPTGPVNGTEQVLTVTLRVDRPESLRISVLDDIVESAKPAHLPHRIEVEQR